MVLELKGNLFDCKRSLLRIIIVKLQETDNEKKILDSTTLCEINNLINSDKGEERLNE